jgi:hypothetical protein
MAASALTLGCGEPPADRPLLTTGRGERAA